ncbi:MAG: CxxxxCH/CxxCH domain-containing protein [Proteobacteria bacterium]|nr:CxxxxCH/CxxCH domain-containing protein [Pseudomonadota bacterium]
MRYGKLTRGLCGIGIVFILSACEGGGGNHLTSTGLPSPSYNDENTDVNTTSITQGVVVDPYIVGAIFQEVGADGVSIIQRQSTPSDQNGVFSFPMPLTVGSTIEMKISTRGLHGGAPFKGILRRNVQDGDHLPVVVSPLTTLMANGAEADDVLAALYNAGFPDLDTDDLYADPMASLHNRAAGITDRNLEPLQAAMAAEAYLETTGNYRPTQADLNNDNQTKILNAMGEAMRSTLTVDEFNRINSELDNDPQVAATLPLDDFIKIAVQQQQTLISVVKTDMGEHGSFNQELVTQTVTNNQEQMVAMARDMLGVTLPDPTPADGATLYADNCADCHGDLTFSRKQNKSAIQIQSAIDTNLGGMAMLSSLTATEVQAIADALVMTSEPPPPSLTPADGPTLYSDNCAGCHGPLETTSKAGRSADDIQSAIDTNIGGMSFLNTLISIEVQAIADALPAPLPMSPDTPPDGVALYNSECAGCHGPLATTTKPGRTVDRIQAAIGSNTGGMGFLNTLTTAEVQAIADVLPAAPPPPAVADGPTLYANNCSGCHGSLADTGKAGRTGVQIQAAIDNNTGGMGFLTSLTGAEVQAIAAALPAPPPPPAVIDGPSLYNNNCSGCHGPLATSAKAGRNAGQIQAAIDNNTGGMGFLTSLTGAEVQAIAAALPAPPPPPAVIDGPSLYSNNCSGCHGPLATSAKAGRNAGQIQAAIDNNVGGMGFLTSLTAAEVQAIAAALPVPPPPPAVIDGPSLYSLNCAGCHGSLDISAKAGRTAAQIQSAINSNIGGMGFLTSLTAAEVQAIAAALPAPPPPPAVIDGPSLYSLNCAGCHGALDISAKAGRTAAQIQSAINSNIGGMGFLTSLTAAEVQAIAAALPAPPPPPAGIDGPTLYSTNCSGCHGALATSTKAGRNAVQIQSAITNNTGGMGFLVTLTAAEVQAIADALPTASPGPDYGDCTTCHGQPPAGSSFPDIAGAHGVHTALPSINNSCAVCHQGHDHNGIVDLGIISTFDAQSGIATPNSNNTCASVSCHGGQTTPDWQTGSIAVDTQCASCHTSGTSQYNSYFSGQHSRHTRRGFSCTVCHNVSKLSNGRHLTDLGTSAFEQDPASTIGGGSTSVGSYSPSNSNASSGTCSSIACHGTERW